MYAFLSLDKFSGRRENRRLQIERILIAFLPLVTSLFLLMPNAQAATAGNFSELKIAKAKVENEINDRIWTARSKAQSEAESYASKELDIWVDKFQLRLRTSGYLDWYFGYFVNKSIKDRELLCHVSHLIPFFPTTRPKCNIFIQKAQDELIDRVLGPIESDLDVINNRALGIFYNSLSRNLHSDFEALVQSNPHPGLTKEVWSKIEQDLNDSVPGFSDGALPAPSSIYLSLVTGHPENERELSLRTEFGEIVLKVPSMFVRKPERVANKDVTEQSRNINKTTIQKTDVKVYSVDSSKSIYGEVSTAGVEGRAIQIEIPNRLIIQETTIEISEMERLGFNTAELSSVAREGEMLGMSALKFQTLADPLFWVPIVLIEGKDYLDLQTSKRSGAQILSEDLGTILREHIKYLVEDDNTGLRALLKRINVGTIASYLP